MLKFYKKKAVQPMRPYVPGEDLTGVSVSTEDTPELGGMIAINPVNPNDMWYVDKKFFEENYEEVMEKEECGTDCLPSDFGWAIRQMKAGKKLARSGWNGKGVFVIYVPGSTVPTLKEGSPYNKAGFDSAFINPHIDMFTADGKFQPGWLASQTDILAEDWEIVQ